MIELLVKGVGLLAGISYFFIIAMMMWAMFGRDRP
jgi:hypothetical protein